MRDRTSALPFLQSWADLLDTKFRIPGTDIRFGLDPLLSLIPGLGDLASPVFTVALLLQGMRQRIPPAVVARMVGNTLVDVILGAIPIAGNVADIFWRANVKNLALLERHATPGVAPTRSDELVAVALVGVLLIGVLLQILVVVWTLSVVFAWLAVLQGSG